MKPFFMAYTGLVGCLGGFACLSCAEILGIGLRAAIINYLPHGRVDGSMFLSAAVIWGTIRIMMVGVPGGYSCAAAAKEWFLNNKTGCKSVCSTAGQCIMVLSVIPLILSALGDFAALSTPPWPLVVFIVILDSFTLQLGFLLLLFARWLPDDSKPTVQITENLRL